jgi:hypothetical protein
VADVAVAKAPRHKHHRGGHKSRHLVAFSDTPIMLPRALRDDLKR